MGPIKKIAAVLIAGSVALAMTAPAAEARNGRNAALIGGLLLGGIAGAAIAGANNHDDGYRYNDGYRYGGPAYPDNSYYYEPPRRRVIYQRVYRPVEPQYYVEDTYVEVPRVYHHRRVYQGY